MIFGEFITDSGRSILCSFDPEKSDDIVESYQRGVFRYRGKDIPSFLSDVEYQNLPLVYW